MEKRKPIEADRESIIKESIIKPGYDFSTISQERLSEIMSAAANEAETPRKVDLNTEKVASTRKETEEPHEELANNNLLESIEPDKVFFEKYAKAPNADFVIVPGKSKEEKRNPKTERIKAELYKTTGEKSLTSGDKNGDYSLVKNGAPLTKKNPVLPNSDPTLAEIIYNTTHNIVPKIKKGGATQEQTTTPTKEKTQTEIVEETNSFEPEILPPMVKTEKDQKTNVGGTPPTINATINEKNAEESYRMAESGIVERYNEKGELTSRIIPGGVMKYYRNGILYRMTFPNGTEEEFDEQGKKIEPVIKSQEKEIKQEIENLSEKESVRKTPEEVADFISKFKLEELLPVEFTTLDKAQKLKVVRDLKRRIVDIVKTDAQIQYSQELKKRVTTGTAPEGSKLSVILKTITSLPGTAFVGIKNAATKETDLKKLEGKVFAELRESAEGKKLIAEDLAKLVEITKSKNLHIDSEGKPYTTYEDLYKGITKPSPEELSALHDFGDKANKFESMPYEWGQEEKGVGIKIGERRIGNTHKKEYEKAKAEYEKTRDEVLKIKASKETPENKGQAMLEMLFVDQNLQMEQLLNTHPEVEKTLEGFKEDAGYKEWAKTGKNFFNVLSGKNWTNRGLIVGGAAARAGAKGAAIATGASGLTFLGGAAVGGVVGGIRGNIRAKETLLEKKKKARYGKKDESKEKAKMVDAIKLASGLEKMSNQVEAATSDEEKAKLLGKLAVVIHYTQNQIESGQVNFGSAREVLQGQFNLVANLNRALVLNEINSEKINLSIKDKINGLIYIQEKVTNEKISEAQKKFIRTQMLKGAAVGAGFTTLGYVFRWAGEEFGWWKYLGEHIHTPAGFQHQAGSEGFTKRTEDWMNNHNPFRHTKTETLDLKTPKAPGLPSDYGNDGTGNPAYFAHDILSQPDNNFPETSVTFDHGHGAIWGIRHLQDQLNAQYHGDFSKAPDGVKTLMEADPTKEAMKLGLYDGKTENALIHVGATLKMDSQGHLLLDDTVSGKHDLIQGDIIKTYDGPMRDLAPHEISHTPASTHLAENPGISDHLDSAKIETDINTLHTADVQRHQAEQITKIQENIHQKIAAAEVQKLHTGDNIPPQNNIPGRAVVPDKNGSVERDFMTSLVAKHEHLPEILQKDIYTLYGQHEGGIRMWDNVRNLKVINEIEKKYPEHTAMGDLVDHLQKLKKLCVLATGKKFEPKTGLFGGKESIENYLKRGLEILSRKGKLQDFETSVGK